MTEFKEKYINPFTDSVNAYRDILNIKNTAFDKGKIEGKIEDAAKMLEKGLDVSLISEITGLTEMEINGLKKNKG